MSKKVGKRRRVKIFSSNELLRARLLIDSVDGPSIRIHSPTSRRKTPFLNRTGYTGSANDYYSSDPTPKKPRREEKLQQKEEEVIKIKDKKPSPKSRLVGNIFGHMQAGIYRRKKEDASHAAEAPKIQSVTPAGPRKVRKKKK